MTPAAPRHNLDDPVLRHARTDFVAIRVQQTVQEVLDQLRSAPVAGT